MDKRNAVSSLNMLPVVTALALTVMALAYAAPAHAEKVVTEVFNPTRLESGDVVEVHLVNFGKKPVKASLTLFDVVSFAKFDEILGEIIDPGSGATLAIAVSAGGVVFPVLRVQSAREAAIIAAAEIRGSGGHVRDLTTSAFQIHEIDF